MNHLIYSALWTTCIMRFQHSFLSYRQVNGNTFVFPWNFLSFCRISLIDMSTMKCYTSPWHMNILFLIELRHSWIYVYWIYATPCSLMKLYSMCATVSSSSRMAIYSKLFFIVTSQMYFRYELQFPVFLYNLTLSLEWHVHEIRIDGDSVRPLSCRPRHSRWKL